MLLTLLTLLLSTPALADNALHGRIELQDFAAFARDSSLDTLFGAQDRNDAAGNLRLTWEPASGAWSLAFHYVVSGDYGGDARLARQEKGLLPAPPATWFNLTNVFENHGDIAAQQTIDRLAVGYSTPDFVVRVGRQALTWGGGLVFRPMDLFDPFSPTATDTEFKPGTDLIYAQWLFADGSDLQGIVVPRPAVKGAAPSADASAFALHFQTRIANLQTAWLVARDHGDWTAAAEMSGPLGGASWDAELVPTFEDHGPTRVSALANISDAVTLFDRNATVFAEYFHNGYGVTADTAFSLLPHDLLDRLARGQVFNLRQDYLAAGMSFEWTPLLTVAPTLLADLDDGSAYALASATYSLSDNLNLIAGAQAPLGPRSSEFGGLRLSPATQTTVGSAPQIYVQLRRYF